MSKISTLELITAIEDVHAHYMYSRVQVMSKITGNPFVAACRNIHGRFCSSIQNPASVLLNRAGGFHELNEQQLVEIIDWYKEQKLTPKITVIPDFHLANFLKLLKSKKFKAAKMWNTAELFAPADAFPMVKPHEEIRISQPETKAELNIFANIYTESFNFPSKLKEGMGKNVIELSKDKNTKLYIGYIGDQPASVGILHIFEKSGYLAMTGTLKKFRKRGLHTAMIHHRIKEAKKAKVRLISGSARVGSTSQKNMERNGLKFSHIQQTWALG